MNAPNNNAPIIPIAVSPADVAKLSPESQASLRGSYRTAGRTDAEIDIAFGTKADPNRPPETEADKMRISLGMTPQAYAEHQQRQGINPNDGKTVDILARPELSAPAKASDYKLPFGMIPNGKPIAEALKEHATIQEAFKLANIPTYSAGAIFEALRDSAATVAQITNPLARSLHNQTQGAVLDRIFPGGKDAALKLAARVTAKFPEAQVKAWRETGALDNARVIALLARVGEIDRDREGSSTRKH